MSCGLAAGGCSEPMPSSEANGVAVGASPNEMT